MAIIWTNAEILLIRILGKNFSEILGEINAISFKKMHLKCNGLFQMPFIKCDVITGSVLH